MSSTVISDSAVSKLSILLCHPDFDYCSEKDLFIAFLLIFEVNLVSRTFSVAALTRHSRDWKFITEPYRN